MKNFTIKKQKNKGISFVLVAIVWLAIWQISAMLVNNPLLLPSIPSSVKALVSLIGEGDFYLNCLATLIRTLASIILSYYLGIFVAWLAYRVKNIERLLSLPVAFFKAVPVMAIIIYFIIIVDSDYVSILVSFLMCFPIVYNNALAGFNDTKIEYLELAQVFKLSTYQTFRYIYLNSMRENLKSALSLIAGMSWKAVIAAEILAIPARAIGYEMLNAKYYLQTPELFAYIAVVILLSLGLEKIIISLANKNNRVSLKLKGQKTEKANINISVDRITKTFENKKVLDEVSFSVSNGEVLAIMAPSGSGKTTIARILAGLDKQDSGNLLIDGELSLSYLFQEDRLMPWMDVYNNIVIGNLNGATRDEIIEIASKLEIEDYLKMYPNKLSGGISHRVALARTMISDSNFIILDEPFRGLDHELKQRIIDGVWADFCKDKAVILISHNQEECNKLANRIIKIIDK